MRKLIGAAGLVLVALIAAAYTVAGPAKSPSRPGGATVKLVAAHGGQCSGGHLGNGIIITAAHCLGRGDLSLISDRGEDAPTEVLWGNPSYDVALLKAVTPVHLAAAGISCRLLPPGAAITVSGIPLAIDFIRTRGEIVSRLIAVDGTWAEAVVANVTAAPGNSGGPVFDNAGQIAGILVGAYREAPTLSIIVPGPTICRLLGRV